MIAPLPEVSTERATRSRRLLLQLMPARPEVWRGARESVRAFELVDGWLNLELAPVLGGGPPADVLSEARPGDYPLAVLLKTQARDAMFESNQQLRAICLAGVAINVTQTALLVQVADGVRKVASADSWSKLVHAPVGAADLADLLDHVSRHAREAVKTRPNLSKPQLTWLADLERWCFLVRESLRRAGPRQPVSLLVRPPPASGFGEEEHESPPQAVVQYDEGYDFDDDADDETRDDGDLVLPDLEPEASGSRSISRPERQGPESSQAGEARRARTGFFTARENQHLVWDNQHLSPLDARPLIQRLEQMLRDRSSPQRAEAGILALAMCTGSLAEQVLGLARMAQTNQSWLGQRCFQRYVPAQPVPADAILSHRTDPIVSQGWKPQARACGLWMSLV
jgi:hypothetical protein